MNSMKKLEKRVEELEANLQRVAELSLLIRDPRVEQLEADLQLANTRIEALERLGDVLQLITYSN